MTGLRDFGKYFQSVLAVFAAGVATTAAVLVTALLGMAPPWPEPIVQITAVAQLVVLIYVYQRMERSTRRGTERVIRTAITVLVVATLAYFSLHSLLVFVMPNGDIGARGIICSTDAQTVYGADCPLLDRGKIAEAEFEAERLWSPVGLLISRLSLLVGWVTSFASLVTLVAAFVAFQRAARQR